MVCTYCVLYTIQKDESLGWFIENQEAQGLLATIFSGDTRLLTIMLLKVKWLFLFFIFHLKFQSNLNCKKVIPICSLKALTQMPSEPYFNISRSRVLVIEFLVIHKHKIRDVFNYPHLPNKSRRVRCLNDNHLIYLKE